MPFMFHSQEANSLDQIKMTKKRLEFDQKIDNNKP